MNKKNIIKSSVVVIVSCSIIIVCYYLIRNWHINEIEKVKIHEEKVWRGEIDNLLDEITKLEKEVSNKKEPDFSEEQLTEISGDGIRKEITNVKIVPLSIEEIEHRIAAFFISLNKQEYYKSYKLKESAYDEYEILIQSVSSKIPVVAGETDSLYNLFLNMAHFYRVLGKERLFLVRDILKNENEKIESLMKYLFLWYTYEYEKKKRVKGRPTLKVLYEYSCFFLNTLGGRSYVLRRDSKFRILMNYYSILALDLANDMKMNPHGIDIRPHLKKLFNDMTNHTGLKYQKDYLNRLKELMDKYEK